jgi:glycosyltransferase involved in cell wall biosynthesis
MPVKPVFSIIIPVYNRPEEVDELLASILIQEYDGVFDVFVILRKKTQDLDLVEILVCKKQQETTLLF